VSPRTTNSLVQHGARDFRPTELPIPDLAPGGALVRVEACGLCGSDIDSLDAHDQVLQFPRIMGHEVIGIVEEIGPGGRPGLAVGDRVALDPWLPCGGCRYCLAGHANHCVGWPELKLACYGYIPLSFDSGLWGGYGEHIVLHPKAVAYPVPAGLDPLAAAMYQPIGAGIEWGVVATGTSPGASVAVLGSGQRGLGAIIANKLAGASLIVATGKGERDARKLALAKDFGADIVVDVEREDAVERVLAATDGEGVDIVVDTSSFSTQPIVQSVAMVRKGGRIAWAGLKKRAVPEFPVDEAVVKGVRIEAVMGTTPESYRRALGLVAANRERIETMRTHTFGFAEAEKAIDVLAGRVPGEDAINVVLVPEG
jgi:threonine dehydrogenase-like Zn-dependent dehydrogenase